MSRDRKYRANTIAKFFINRASEETIGENGEKEGITNLKLQKLLYFAQASFLSSKMKKAIFSDNIEAWKYGPVVPSVYQDFKDYGNKPIVGEYNLDIDSKDEELLNEVWEVFGQYSAGHLVDMTHAHKPWKEAYSKGENTVITIKSIQEYYKGLL